MEFTIEYLRTGKVIGATPWTASLDDTAKFARDCLVKLHADTARILNEDGKVAALVKR
jgi:hypothetical protein